MDYKGITVAEDTELRAKMREAGVDYFVMKNTLSRFAVKNAGLDELCDVLKGTTSIALCQGDPVAAAKVVSEFSKKLAAQEKFTVKAGFVDGKVIDAAGVKALADLPPAEEGPEEGEPLPEGEVPEPAAPPEPTGHLATAKQALTDTNALLNEMSENLTSLRPEVEELRRMESRSLPDGMDYMSIQGLRLEAREKLNAVRPLNLGQAARISGVSPADVAALMIWLER